MSQLLKGWVETNFENVSDYIQRGKGPKYVEFSEYPVVNQKAVRWFGIQEEHLKYVHPEQWAKWDELRYIREGDILWNSTGTGTIGRACHIDQTQLSKAKVVDSHITIVRTNKLVESKFAFYWIMHPKIQGSINGLYNGSTNQVELSKKIVESTRFPLAPLAEQTSIVKKLDEVLVKVEATQARLARIPDIIKQFRQSVLAAALSGKLTEEWRNINNVKIQEWSSNALADIASVIDPNPSHRYPEPEAQGVPILSTQQFIGDSGWTKEKSKLVSKSFHSERMEKCGFFESDIVFARKGRLGLARFSPSGFDYVYSHTLFIVRAKKAVYPKFLLWSLRPNSVVEHLLMEMNSNTGVPTLGKSVFERMKICLPSYIEQTEIVRRVEQLFAYADTIEQQAKAAKERVDNLTQAILAKAFRGELTADWRAANPDLISGDNSAAALLARIQTERATASGKKGKRGTSKTRTTA